MHVLLAELLRLIWAEQEPVSAFAPVHFTSLAVSPESIRELLIPIGAELCRGAEPK